MKLLKIFKFDSKMLQSVENLVFAKFLNFVSMFVQRAETFIIVF